MPPIDQRPRLEEIEVSGEKLLSTLKELIHQGNIRRVILKNESGTTLVEIPLTAGLVGVILLPQIAAVGAIAALVARCTIVLERIVE